MAGSAVMCVMHDLYSSQLCARDIDRGSVGHNMREQMSCGRTRINRISGCRVFCESWAGNAQESLKGRVSGEGTDYVCHHQGGFFVPSPIILEKRGIYYVINDVYIE